MKDFFGRCFSGSRMDDALTGYHEGAFFYMRGQPLKALECFDKALAMDPRNKQSLFGKGFIFEEQGKYEEAFVYFNKVLEIDSNFKGAWNEKGFILDDLGKYAEALECYNKALSIEANCKVVLNNKGLTLRAKGKYVEALECYDKALEIDRRSEVIWNNKGVIFKLQGKYAEALECFDKALVLAPHLKHAWFHRGSILFYQKKYKESRICFEKILSIYPRYVSALQGQAVWHFYKGSREEAVRLFEQVQAAMEDQKLAPLLANYWCERADLFFSIGEWAQAKICFEKALSIFPENFYANQWLSEIHVRSMSIENFPHKMNPSTNFISAMGLNKDVAALISTHLCDRDLVNLCMTSKGLYSIFYSPLEKRLMPYFLKYLVEGRLDKVEEILNRNQKLVLLQGDITDLSGRVFKRITAFQYATWALDKEMWELILRYLPEMEAYDQLIELEQKRPDITEVYGKRCNFQPLLDAYQKYMDNFEVWSAAERWDQLEACWCKDVGGAQRQMPAWFVYVFCEEGEDKACITNHFKKNFTRDPKHLRWWFDQEYNDGKLGFKWAAARGEGVDAVAAGPVTLQWARLDRQHLNSWKAKRTSCRDVLSDYLKSVVERKNSAIKPNNFGKK